MPRIYLNRGWRFTDTFSDDLIRVPMRDGTEVSIPHTVAEVPFHYFDSSVYEKDACYQRTLFAPLSWRGRCVLLTFEAVGHYACVYVNGREVGEHRCGYTAFTIEISDYLSFGRDNLITVRCDSRESINQPPFGHAIDYMTFGGIYRDVYLEVKSPVYMKDVFYQPTLTESPHTNGMSLEMLQSLTMQGKLFSTIELSMEAKKMAQQHRLFVCQFLDNRQISNQPLSVEGKTTTLAGNVHIWDVSNPRVYEIRTEIRLDGETVDTDVRSIGFRDIKVQAKGLFLNGRRLKLRGMNRHQSYPYVGYAMPESMQRLDARILKKELGLNAVRTSHYPQSRYFIDECDRMGLLVFTEIPGWQHIGDAAWKDICVENVKEMVRQYRNHPSVFLWGVRVNESRDCDDLYLRTNEAAHLLDGTRLTGGVRAGKKMHLLEDVYTYNDFSYDGTNAGCEPKGSVSGHLSKPYLISEYNGHMFPTKTFDWEEKRTEHAIRHAAVMDEIAKHDDILGGFGWCMCDYNTHRDFGSGDGICYHGVMDMFRNPKTAAYVYAAQTNRAHVLCVTSSMDIGEHPATTHGKVYIISNADSVRMYKDNVMIKEYRDKSSAFKHLRHGPILVDDYIGEALVRGEKWNKRRAKLAKLLLNQYAIGGNKMTVEGKKALAELALRYHTTMEQLQALYKKYVGDWGAKSSVYRFDAVKDGQVVKSVLKQPVTSKSMAVTVSSKELFERITYDVAAFRIAAVDDNGNVLPYYGEVLRVETAGPIALIGPSLLPFRGGYAGFYVKSCGEPGDAVIRVSAEGLGSHVVKLAVRVAADSCLTNAE